ncbi:hypothetical protein BDN70DRAFT_614987 [Pholiota conissans]|uniref:Uncharacterized protein n=1 Tax=Pholiota conissans TaxID=109636 RepID=A0A9P5Z590_9AGAR|nr:hypothetical protein BDN70DRAFT_614987 [Pholiota conissans]
MHEAANSVRSSTLCEGTDTLGYPKRWHFLVCLSALGFDATASVLWRILFNIRHCCTSTSAMEEHLTAISDVGRVQARFLYNGVRVLVINSVMEMAVG